MIRREIFPTFHAAADLARRGWRWSRPWLAGVVLLSLGAYVIANVAGGRALERELARIREAGEPLSLREAAPPAVPDEVNAAVLYDRAFHRLPRLERDPQSLPGGQPQWRVAREDERVLSDFLADDPEKQRRAGRERVRQALAGTEAALDLAREAAGMPRCRFAVDWEAGAAALFPHYPRLRSLTRLLGAHAVLAAVDGKPAEAVVDLQAMIGITRHIGSEPLLIGQLVQYACQSMALSSLNQVMRHASLSDAESRRLQETLAAVDLYPSFEGAVATERAFGLWMFDTVRDGGVSAEEFGTEPGSFLRLLRRLRPAGEPLLKWDQVHYLRLMGRQVDLARLHRHLPPAEWPEMEAEIPRYAVVSRLMLPALSAAASRRDEAVARLALARWALALHVYQAQTGRYPDSLQEAERVAGGSLPEDPFSGRALIYRPQGQGYRLYSIGGNGRDDGGERRRERGSALNEGSSAPPDDIAWSSGG
jgi:hypothetical protein